MLRGLVEFAVVDGMFLSIFNMMYHNRIDSARKIAI
jgi:hypothetical protein